MKVGLQIPSYTTPRGPEALGRELVTVARTADAAGFDYIAVMDHFFQIPVVGPAEMEMLEGYTTLGYLAACTSRAALLTVATGACRSTRSRSGSSGSRRRCRSACRCGAAMRSRTRASTTSWRGR
jgi:hypothetical protein